VFGGQRSGLGTGADWRALGLEAGSSEVEVQQARFDARGSVFGRRFALGSKRRVKS
jgi:hypothetical protein